MTCGGRWRKPLPRWTCHGIRIDWLKPLIPAYLHILDRATDERWLDQPIRIASAEGLILLKLLAFRSQDQVDIENLVAANRDTLDLDWIQAEWEPLADLDDPRMLRLLAWVGGGRTGIASAARTGQCNPAGSRCAAD